MSLRDVLVRLKLVRTNVFTEKNNEMAQLMSGLFPMSMPPYWKELANEGNANKRRTTTSFEPALPSKVN